MDYRIGYASVDGYGSYPESYTDFNEAMKVAQSKKDALKGNNPFDYTFSVFCMDNGRKWRVK